MSFSFFKKKKQDQREVLTFSFKEEFENIYSFLCSHFNDDFEGAKKRFVELTGQFDDENEYFNSKMDDFRHWFLFFYKYKSEFFYSLKKIQSNQELKKFYEPLSCGVFSVFQITGVKDDTISMKDMVKKNKYTLNDSSYSVSLSEGDIIQTAVFETSKDEYSFGMSMINHPIDTKSFIQKKIKLILKDTNKKTSTDEEFKKRNFEFLNELLVMRYQLFKYRQVKVNQIYNDSPLTKKTTDGEQ